MHSPTTPRPSASLSLRTLAWRPWSMPVDRTVVRRKICGLLNRVAPANVDRIADRFAKVVNDVERSRQSSVVHSCAKMLIERCLKDPLRIALVARLVQRAVDEAEGESLGWRSVDPYYLEDLTDSVYMTLKTTLLEQLDIKLRHGQEREACALSTFLGELLVLGVISCDDVQDVLLALFTGTAQNSDLSCVVLCRTLRRIAASTEASHIIDALGLVDHIESVLEEDTISVKIRYMVMSTLDQCLYPRPTDVFGSDLQRNEAYGLYGEEGAVMEPPGDVFSSPLLTSGESRQVAHECARSVSAMFRTRDLIQSEQKLLSLPQSGRHVYISRLVSVVMASGDDSDAALASSFLSLPSVRRANQANDMAKVFDAEVSQLEDTVMDVPSAYRIMAMLLQASAAPIHVVETLASRIVMNENPARDRLLEEVRVCSGDLGDQLDQSYDNDTSEEETASDYACAY